MAEWSESFAERGRSAARQAELAARMDGPLRDYLPSATPGWSRVERSPVYFDKLSGKKPRESSAEERRIMAAVEQETSYKVMKTLDTVAATGRDMAKARRGWVYMRGNDMVIVQLKRKDLGMQARAKRLATALGMAQSKDLDDRPLAALHRGAAFHDTRPRQHGNGYRVLKAALGTGEIEVLVQTNASQKELDKLLRRIDYPGLYALMGDTVEHEAMARHHALRQRLSKDRFEQQYAAAKDREIIDRRLAAAVKRARGSNVNEVCIEHNGKQHCAWVN